MRYGISAAALVVGDEGLLLVHHQDEGYDFWLPPGGGVQGHESILECARRETLEETGLVGELDRILYIQEFRETGYHFCKFFILGRKLSGDLTLTNREPGESFLVEARFFSQDDLQAVTVHPEVLRDGFWEDRKGECAARYLGLERLRY